MWNQFPEQGVRAELSREMGRYGAAAAASLPSQSSLAAMNPLGSPSWLIAREKRAAGAKSEEFSSAAAVPCWRWAMGEGQAARAALPTFPKKPATSSIFPLTTTPTSFTPTLLPFLHSPTPQLLIAKSFTTVLWFLATIPCITPLGQYPLLPCLFCVQLVTPRSSWVNWIWQVWSTFSCDQSRSRYHSTLYDAAFFQYRKKKCLQNIKV